MGNLSEPVAHQPPPVYAGQLVVLRHVSSEDLPLLLRWRTDVRQLHNWSMTRSVPTVEAGLAEIEQILRQSITFLALAPGTSEAIGFVQAYNVNLKDRWALIRFFFEAQYQDDGSCPEACLAFLDYLFQGVRLRKVYFDLFEGTEKPLGSAILAALVEEGRFREHAWRSGRYWDMARYSLYREVWLEVRERASIILNVQQDARALSMNAPKENG
jgi:RimJ/RimL family protein N-acetyltransferase